MSDRLTAGFDFDVTRQQLQQIEIHGTNFDIILLADEISQRETNTQSMNITDELQVRLGLQNISQPIFRYDNVQQCIAQLRVATNRRIILFISRNDPLDGRDLLAIRNLRQVEYMYEFGSESPCKKFKRKILNNVDQSSQVESDFHIIPSNMDTTLIQDLDDETKKQFIKQLLLEVLQKLPYTTREINVFRRFFLSNYDRRTNYFQTVRQEINQLSRKSAIWFYTGDHIHRVLSKILREGNATPIIQIHYFINRLYKELNELFQSQLSNRLRSTDKIYRGKNISIQEFERFKRAVGKFVLTNSFVSTSESKEIALIHSRQGKSKSQDEVPVVFVMKIAAYDNPLKPIAFLEKDAREDFENELLLTSGIIFRVDGVKKVEGRWEIFLVRDVDEIEYEKHLYLILWLQIYSMIPDLNGGNLLPEDFPLQQRNEYYRQIMRILQTMYLQMPNRLQTHQFRYSTLANDEVRTQASHNGLIAVDLHTYPGSSLGPPLETSGRYRSMNLFARWTNFYQTRPYLKWIILAIVLLIIIIIVLSITIPLVVISQSTSMAVANANSFDSDPPT